MIKLNKINIGCYLLFGLLFIIMLTIQGYGVYFLTKLGISYIDIGLTIGISALISSILQPILGRIVDTYHFSWQKMLVLLNLVMSFSLFLMFFVNNVWCQLIFALMIILSGCMYPFITYSPFYYSNHGFETNFGVARGFGSLTFTVFASVIGFIVMDSNFMIIPLFSLISSVLMIIVVYLLPYYGFEHQSAGNKNFRKNIFTKYPIFTLILITLIFLMTFQNLFECYMINIIENIGGNISDVGVSNSIAAFLELPVMFFFIKILDKCSAKNLIIISSVFYIIRSLTIVFATDIFGIYLSQILQILTFAIILPASVHFAYDEIEKNDQYEAQAYLGSTITIGLIFANFIGGNVLQLYDINALLIILVILTVLGSIFALSTLFIPKYSKN